MHAKTTGNFGSCVAVFALVGAGSGCTTLGPTPAMTGIPSPPLERPGVELQAAAVPGYFLSGAATEEPKGAALPQVAAVFEPDELIHVPGLLAGARYAGEHDSGAALEPLVGYRTFLDEDKRFSLATLGFLAYADGSANGASFTAFRGGLEAGVDARLTPRSNYAELHTNLGLTFTGLNADGTYCLSAGSPFGVDCPENPNPEQRVNAHASGIFPSAHAGASLDFARHLWTAFHGLRLAFDLAGGTMPTVSNGQQHRATLYGSGGLSLTVGLGASTGSGAR